MSACYHVVIKGKEDETRAFIEGLIVGANAYGSIWFLDDINVAREGILDWFKDLIHPDHAFSILTEEHLIDLIQRGINDESMTFELKIVATKKVKQAGFKFSVETFSKEHGEKIKNLLEERPKDVFVTEETRFKTKIDPKAEGVELYAPVHDFEYRGKGKIFGKPREVIKIYLQAAKEPLINLEKIEFEFE